MMKRARDARDARLWHALVDLRGDHTECLPRGTKSSPWPWRVKTGKKKNMVEAEKMEKSEMRIHKIYGRSLNITIWNSMLSYFIAR